MGAGGGWLGRLLARCGRVTIPPAQPESWSGEWFNPPPQVEQAEDGTLRVTAAEGSDAWQRTYYGFTPDSAHALLRPFTDGTALEVSLELDFGELYDQAGILVRSDATHWTKAGAEITDGRPHVGAVVTTDAGSDWSVAPVPEWSGGTVTIRVRRPLPVCPDPGRSAGHLHAPRRRAR